MAHGIAPPPARTDGGLSAFRGAIRIEGFPTMSSIPPMGRLERTASRKERSRCCASERDYRTVTEWSARPADIDATPDLRVGDILIRNAQRSRSPPRTSGLRGAIAQKRSSTDSPRCPRSVSRSLRRRGRALTGSASMIGASTPRLFPAGWGPGSSAPSQRGRARQASTSSPKDGPSGGNNRVAARSLLGLAVHAGYESQRRSAARSCSSFAEQDTIAPVASPLRGCRAPRQRRSCSAVTARHYDVTKAVNDFERVSTLRSSSCDGTPAVENGIRRFEPEPRSRSVHEGVSRSRLRSR